MFPGASGEGKGVDSHSKVFTFLRKSFSQVLVVFHEFSLVKSAFVAGIISIKQYLTQSKVSTSLPQKVQG